MSELPRDHTDQELETAFENLGYGIAGVLEKLTDTRRFIAEKLAVELAEKHIPGYSKMRDELRTAWRETLGTAVFNGMCIHWHKPNFNSDDILDAVENEMEELSAISPKMMAYENYILIGTAEGALLSKRLATRSGQSRGTKRKVKEWLSEYSLLNNAQSGITGFYDTYRPDPNATEQED